jgi:hypothetical protein
MNNQQMKATALQAMDIAAKVFMLVATCFVALVAYEGKTLVSAMHDHEKRITAIESSRYTSTDALRDMRDINVSINGLKTWIETRYPPDWLKKDVDELKDEMRLLRATMYEYMLRGSDGT